MSCITYHLSVSQQLGSEDAVKHDEMIYNCHFQRTLGRNFGYLASGTETKRLKEAMKRVVLKYQIEG